MKAPSNEDRIAVIGRSGSGKTQFSVWLLGALRLDAWSDMPITLFDPKRSKLIRKLIDAKVAQRISIDKRPPKTTGLYVVQPQPVADDQAVLDYLQRVYEQEKHATYFDEILDLGNRNRGFRRLLTQGRELKIPMLYCTQRPYNCDAYSLSEAEYIAAFALRNPDDIDRVSKYSPEYDPSELGKYQCHWYDVGSDEGVNLRPAPSVQSIMSLYTGRSVQPQTQEALEDQSRRRSML